MVKVDGFTQIKRALDLPLIASLVTAGDQLGELWQQGLLLTEAEKAVGEIK